MSCSVREGLTGARLVLPAHGPVLGPHTTSRLLHCDLSKTRLPPLDGPSCSSTWFSSAPAPVPASRLPLYLALTAVLSLGGSPCSCSSRLFCFFGSFIFAFLGCSGVGAGRSHVCLPAVPLFCVSFHQKGSAWSMDCFRILIASTTDCTSLSSSVSRSWRAGGWGGSASPWYGLASL